MLTLAYNGAFPLAFVAGSIAGAVTLACTLIGWKSDNKVFATVASLAFIWLGLKAGMTGGVLWGVPQALSVAMLVLCFPLWLLGPAIRAWLGPAKAN